MFWIGLCVGIIMALSIISQALLWYRYSLTARKPDKAPEPQKEESADEKKAREANERLGKDLSNMMAFDPYDAVRKGKK